MKKHLYTFLCIICILSAIGIATMKLNDIPFNGIGLVLCISCMASASMLVKMDSKQVSKLKSR